MAIDLVAAAGAEVDRDTLTAKLPWALVEDCLAKVPRDILLAARDPERDVHIDDGAMVTTSDGTATYLMDDRSGRRLEGSAEALARTTRLFDGLPEIDFVWPSLSARDLDPVTANLEIEAITLRNTTKHVQDEVRSPEYVEPLVEILEAIAGASLWERPIFSTINCTVAPLQHDRPMTEASIALARAGVPILILPMALMGTTGPMTTLGTTIVNMAELLSAVVLFELAAPGCQVYSGIGSASADMRTGFYLCGNPEAVLVNLIGIEMSRFYGLRAAGKLRNGRREATQLPGRGRGGDDRGGLRRRRRRSPAVLRAARWRHDPEPRGDRAAVRHDGHDPAAGAPGADRRLDGALRRHPRRGYRRTLPWPQVDARVRAQGRALAAADLPARSVRRLRRAVAARRGHRARRDDHGRRTRSRRCPTTSRVTSPRWSPVMRRRMASRPATAASGSLATGGAGTACRGAGETAVAPCRIPWPRHRLDVERWSPCPMTEIRPLTQVAELDALRRLGIAAGLDAGDDRDEDIVVAWGAFDDRRPRRRVALEHFTDLDLVGWLAVARRRARPRASDDVCSRRSKTKRVDAGSRSCGRPRRAPGFFIRNGYAVAGGGCRARAPSAGCLDCDQYQETCHPKIVRKGLGRDDRQGPLEDDPPQNDQGRFIAGSEAERSADSREW